MLTVREMLLYTAELKRPMSEPLASKEAAVDELLRKLALESCAGVRIGSRESKGISGGQAKRTNIGIALVTNPRVLFLDEPTSGALYLAVCVALPPAALLVMTGASAPSPPAAACCCGDAPHEALSHHSSHHFSLLLNHHPAAGLDSFTPPTRCSPS